MIVKTLITVAVTAAMFAAAPAQAASWTKNVDLCASAAEAEGLVNAGEYRAKYLSGKGGAVKTLKIELISNDGNAQTAICKIRRGVVSEVSLDA